MKKNLQLLPLSVNFEGTIFYTLSYKQFKMIQLLIVLFLSSANQDRAYGLEICDIEVKKKREPTMKLKQRPKIQNWSHLFLLRNYHPFPPFRQVNEICRKGV